MKCEQYGICNCARDEKDTLQIPTSKELEEELHRIQYRGRYKSVFRSTLAMLIVAAAMAILTVTLWMPVLQICGNSMNPTLEEGEIVVLTKSLHFKTGDMIAFYYNNKILIKRVIAQSGDWIDISENGTVSVNKTILNEPYVSQIDYGECDLKFPYQVPDNRVFVMGDHRGTSIDSRSSQIGCVAEEQIVGKLMVRVWPFRRVTIF